MTDQEYDKIITMRPLSELLPITFINGRHVDDISVSCSTCQKDIAPEDTRTDLVFYEHSAAVEAYAVCYSCHLITPYNLRLSDDGTMLVAKGDGTWVKASYTTPSSGWYSFIRFITDKWRQLWVS